MAAAFRKTLEQTAAKEAAEAAEPKRQAEVYQQLAYGTLTRSRHSGFRFWPTRTWSGKSFTQVVLRWLTQRDVVVIPKSVRPERTAENLDIFDFQLTNDEMSRIATLDTGASLFFDYHDPAMVSWLNSGAE